MPVPVDVTMCVHANVPIHVAVTVIMVRRVVHVTFIYYALANVIIVQELPVHVTTTHIVNVMCDTVQVVVVQRFAVVIAQLVDVRLIRLTRVRPMVHHNHKRGHVHVIATTRRNFLIKNKRLDKL